MERSFSLLVFGNHNISMKLIFFYLLLLLLHAQTTVLERSNLQTQLITQGYSLSLSTFHNAYHPNMIGPGAFWVWNDQGRASFPGRTLTFESLFHLSCSSPVQLNLTADDSFKAYLDGKLIAQGNNWHFIYSVTIDLTCGSHNLTIVVKQGFGQYGPGLIYILSQNQDNCFNCGLNGLWDYSTCGCRCLTICGCAKPQFWMNYPICACRCPGIALSEGSTQRQNTVYFHLLTKSRVQLMDTSDSSCGPESYFNHQTCSCQCKPKYCKQRWRWNPDPKVCKCEFIP